MIVVMAARTSQLPAEIKAADFKAKCLELMDAVARTGSSVVITKRGVPVARLVPAADRADSLLGFAKGAFVETGDIVAPLDLSWEPDPLEIERIASAASRGTKRARRPAR